MTAIATTQTTAYANPNDVLTAALECPECCAEVALDQSPILHEILPCGDCGAELEVIGVDPVAIDLAPEVEEDWGE